MDDTATQWINSFSGQWWALDFLAKSATNFGIPAMILFTVISWWQTHDRPSARHACITAALAFLAGLAVNQIIVLFIHRVRPYDAGLTHLLIEPNPDWSFPSDHATGAMAIAAALWFKAQKRLAVIFSVVAFLVMVSRVYVGIHYVSDVIAGAMIAIASAFIVSKLFRESWQISRFLVSIF